MGEGVEMHDTSGKLGRAPLGLGLKRERIGRHGCPPQCSSRLAWCAGLSLCSINCESRWGVLEGRALVYLLTTSHPMCVKRFYFFAVLSGLAASGVLRVDGIKVYMSSTDVEAVNGTNVRLKCTFTSTSPINPSTLTISWSFRPLVPGREESVFYFHDKPYPPPEGRFRKRVDWAGDIMGRDASIVLREVKFTFNGTYVCQVKNPPDAHGNAGEVTLRVVTTASFSEIAILAASVGGAIVIIVIILIIVLCVKRCRKDRPEDLEEAPRRERKDPTVCHPARAAHLYVVEPEYEIDSSDGMISEASTKNQESSSEDDRSSDDVGGYGSD